MQFLKIIFTAMFCFILANCDKKSTDETLVAGTSADNPPFEFIKDGEFAGLEIDIAHAIAEKLGKKLIIKNFDFNGLLASLSSKNIDLAVSGFSVTKARLEKVDFTKSYISATVAVLCRKDDHIENQQDLKGKKIGVLLGTVLEDVARDIAKETNGEIHTLSNNLMLIEELKSGMIDALILEEAQVKKFIDNNSKFASFILQSHFSEVAMALPKGSDLTQKINDALDLLEKEGKIAEIKKKWLD